MQAIPVSPNSTSVSLNGTSISLNNTPVSVQLALEAAVSLFIGSRISVMFALLTCLTCLACLAASHICKTPSKPHEGVSVSLLVEHVHLFCKTTLKTILFHRRFTYLPIGKLCLTTRWKIKKVTCHYNPTTSSIWEAFLSYIISTIFYIIHDLLIYWLNFFLSLVLRIYNIFDWIDWKRTLKFCSVSY